MNDEANERAAEHARILEAIAAEIPRQDEKYGVQDHADVDPSLTNREGGCTTSHMARLYEVPTAERATLLRRMAKGAGSVTWAHLHAEKLAEIVALATVAAQTTNSAVRRGLEERVEAKLVQLAALAVNHIGTMRRRRTAP